MSKSKSTKKTAATSKVQATPKAKKTEAPAAKAAAPEIVAQPDPKKETFKGLCVFAFRLIEEERNAIHKAAGPAKASKFVRTLAVAAARNDEAAVKAIMQAAHATE